MRNYSASDLLSVVTESGQYAHYCLKIDWPHARRSLCGLTDVYLEYVTDERKFCVKCRGFVS